MRILDTLRRFRFRSLNRSGYLPGEERSIENTDALAAKGMGELDSRSGDGPASFPPNYVREDDGRPRH